jgi:predicted membrane-bound dolichyl-phosphate-mannose-protein mannosyltransferase
VPWTATVVTRSIVRLAPWDYLLKPFNTHTFPDIYTTTWVASIALLVVLVVLYNVRTKALHRHAPYLDMWEWLLWTGISLFGLVLVAATFNFYLLVLLVILATGLAVMLWVRFVRFPPLFEVYEQKMAKQRYFTRSKFAHPESTIRPKGSKSAAGRSAGSRPSAGRGRANRRRRK